MTCRVVYGNWVLTNNVLQSPIYYGDGYDPDRVITKHVPEFYMSNHEFQAKLNKWFLPPGMDIVLMDLRLRLLDTKANSSPMGLTDEVDLPYDIAELFQSEYYADLASSTRCPTLATESWDQLKKLHNMFSKWTSPESISVVRFYDMIALAKLFTSDRMRHRFHDLAFVKKVFARAERQFALALYAGGAQVGRIASMRIAKEVTQIALDSHRSGGANHGSSGIKRFETILSLTETPPHMAAMMIDCESMDHACKVAKSICTVLFSSVIFSVQVEHEAVHMEEDAPLLALATNIYRLSGTFSHFYPQPNHGTYRSNKKAFAIASSIIRIVLDKTKCIQTGIDIARVSRKVEARFLTYLTPVSSAKTRADFITSAPYMDTWVIRIRITQKIVDGLHKARKSLEEFVASDILQSMYVGGIDRITAAHAATREEMYYDTLTHQLKTRSVPYVWTCGTNLRGAMAHDMVNPLKVTSNCIQDTRVALGMLAACSVFYREMKAVMGTKVKDRHIFLLTQSILSHGILCGVNRHGLKTSGTPIAQMCFENGRKVVLDLARGGVVDDCQDDMSAILLGRRSRAGTGIVKFKPVVSQKRKLISFNTKDNMLFSQMVKRARQTKHKPIQPCLVLGQQEQEVQIAAINQFLIGNPCDPHLPMVHCNTSSSMVPASPKYTPNSPSYIPSSPDYILSSPPMAPNSPDYLPNSPPMAPNSPEYIPHSPPMAPNSPDYIPHSPPMAPNSPEYIPHSPPMAPNSPEYIPHSPPSENDENDEMSDSSLSCEDRYD